MSDDFIYPVTVGDVEYVLAPQPIRTSLTAYAVNSLDIGSPPFNC